MQVSASVDDHGATAMRKFQSDCLADSAARAGDDHDPWWELWMAHRLVRGFVRRRFIVELLPFNGVFHRFDSQDEVSVLIDTNGSARLADDDCDSFGALGDPSGGPVSRTESFGKLQVLVEDFDDLARAFDDSIGGDDKTAIHLCDFFDVFTYARIVQGAVYPAVAFQWIDTACLVMGYNFCCLPYNVYVSDLFSLQALSSVFEQRYV